MARYLFGREELPIEVVGYSQVNQEISLKKVFRCISKAEVVYVLLFVTQDHPIIRFVFTVMSWLPVPLV